MRRTLGIIIFICLISAISYHDPSGGVFKPIQMLAALVIYPQHASTLLGPLIGQILGYSAFPALIVWAIFRKQAKPKVKIKTDVKEV